MNIIKRYLAAMKAAGKSECTLQTYSGLLNRFDEFLKQEDINILQVDSNIIAEWVEQSFEGLSNNTMRHYLIILHSFYAWCLRHKLVDENPILPEDTPCPKRIEYAELTLEEIRKLLRTDPEGICRGKILRNRALITLLLLCGLRSDEIRSLRYNDLDFEKEVITVQHGKGDKFRQVPFPSLARQILREYINSMKVTLLDNFLFGTERKSGNRHKWDKMSSQRLNNIVHSYVYRITGRTDIHTHTLRHAYASLCDTLGVPVRTIQKTMGHASIATTERIYISVLNRAKAAQEINSVMNSAV